MTKSTALFIKFLRVREGCTYGKLFSHWYNRYELGLPYTNEEIKVNSYNGRTLCHLAQDVLNENWQDEC